VLEAHITEGWPLLKGSLASMCPQPVCDLVLPCLCLSCVFDLPACIVGLYKHMCWHERPGACEQHASLFVGSLQSRLISHMCAWLQSFVRVSSRCPEGMSLAEAASSSSIACMHCRMRIPCAMCVCSPQAMSFGMLSPPQWLCIAGYCAAWLHAQSDGGCMCNPLSRAPTLCIVGQLVLLGGLEHACTAAACVL
jgi:hypothetical protein